MALAIVLSLICAALQALSAVVQHKAAFDGEAPARRSGRKLVALLRNKLWLLGFVLVTLAFPFQVAALGLSSVAVVQPLLVTVLLFLLPFAALLGHTRITRRDWASALLVAAGLAGFLIAARPTEGHEPVSNAEWFLACAGTLAACGLLIGVGYRFHGAAAAAILGTAGGLVNGLLGPVTKAAVDLLSHQGIGALVASWLLYATLVLSLLGVALPLLAFQVGPITASMPTITIFNPVLATFLGGWLFGDTIRETPLALLMAGVCVALMTWGVIVVARSQAVRESFETR